MPGEQMELSTANLAAGFYMLRAVEGSKQAVYKVVKNSKLIKKIIFNGRLVIHDQPLLYIDNRSFRYGDGLFESMQYHNGRIWWLSHHLERLYSGMQFLSYQNGASLDPDRLYSDIRLLEPPAHARIRLQVFRDGGGKYPPETNAYQYLLEAEPLGWDQYPEWETGLIVGLYKEVPVRNFPLSRFKSAYALPYVLAAQSASQCGLDDVILFNAEGFPVEASASNLFIWEKERLFTPPEVAGCLPGILRQQLMNTAGDLGIEVLEEAISLERMLEADSLWLTNSISGIRWVGKLKGKEYLPGPLRTFVHKLNKSALTNE